MKTRRKMPSMDFSYNLKNLILGHIWPQNSKSNFFSRKSPAPSFFKLDGTPTSYNNQKISKTGSEEKLWTNEQTGKRMEFISYDPHFVGPTVKLIARPCEICQSPIKL